MASQAPTTARPPESSADGNRVTREDLKSALDQYLDALCRRDPAALQVTPAMRFTENTAHLQLGEGLWRTITGLGSYKHYFMDEVSGQAGFIGLIEENGIGARLTLRIKLEDGKFSEIETLVVRSGEMDSTTEPKSINPVWLEPLVRPHNREEIVQIADRYFEAIERNDGDAVAFNPSAIRTENGKWTTSNPHEKAPFGEIETDDGVKDFFALDLKEQFDVQSNGYIESVTPRRWLIVDEQQGLAFGFFRFNVAGNVTKQSYMKGARQADMVPEFQRPLSGLMAEAFKVDNGQICHIDAEFISVPYKASDGWSDR